MIHFWYRHKCRYLLIAGGRLDLTRLITWKNQCNSGIRNTKLINQMFYFIIGLVVGAVLGYLIGSQCDECAIRDAFLNHKV